MNMSEIVNEDLRSVKGKTQPTPSAIAKAKKKT